MKVSLAWLNALCDPGLVPAALAERLTRQGLEAGIPAPVAAPAPEIVAARCVEVKPIARSNYRHILADAGALGRFGVVTAAPNVVRGMMTALALPGATLPDGRVIVTHEYAGLRSEAMLCSAAELGLGELSDRLLELPKDAAPGMALAEVYGLPDCVIELDLTANRGDCLSMVGIARELHASSDAPLDLPPADPVAVGNDERVAIGVEVPEVCPRYLGRVIIGLDPAAKTPLWLTERLRRAGQRTTHPVVDVLNYVMLELGQPLHAFDREKIAGAIRVRYARAGERLVLLGGAEAELTPDMLVIGDDDGPVALAGIMGGTASAVSPGTRSIFIESAHFSPAAIRGRARRLGLATDASHRYERGVDPGLPRAAIERASALIAEITGGIAGPIVTVETPKALPACEPIHFDPGSLPRLVGFALPVDEIERILSRLGFGVEATDEKLVVTPPGARFDIRGEADLVEEVARIAGFERIPAAAPRRHLAAPRNGGHDEDVGRRLASVLFARGYDETVTLSLVAPARNAALAPAGSAAPALANPLSERESVLRCSLWPGLLGALAHNVAQGAARVRLFERGTVFDVKRGEHDHLGVVTCGSALPEQWGVHSRRSDFYDIKGIAEALLAAAGVGALEFEPMRRAGLAPGRAAHAVVGGKTIAEFGFIDPALAAAWDLPPATLLLELDLSTLMRPALARARALPRFPSVRRDLALVVPARVTAAALLALARRHAGERLAEAFVFDVYTGAGIPEGTRGIGVGLIFRDFCRTLTDAEVDVAVSAIVTGLAEEANIHVRS